MSAVSYKIDPVHSNAHFKVRHLMVSTVRGEFSKVSGSVRFDPDRPEAIAIEAAIEAASVNTRDETRDTHLRSADFLEVEKHPEIRFQSKRATSQGKGKLDVVGDLSIRGVSKEITLKVDGLDTQVKDPWGGIRMGASASTRINRKEFGLVWNTALEAGGVMVGDTVDILIDVELIQEA